MAASATKDALQFVYGLGPCSGPSIRVHYLFRSLGYQNEIGECVPGQIIKSITDGVGSFGH